VTSIQSQTTFARTCLLSIASANVLQLMEFRKNLNQANGCVYFVDPTSPASLDEIAHHHLPMLTKLRQSGANPITILIESKGDLVAGVSMWMSCSAMCIVCPLVLERGEKECECACVRVCV